MIAYRDANSGDGTVLGGIARATFIEFFGALYSLENLTAFLATTTDAAYAAELADPMVEVRFALAAGSPIGFCKIGPLKLPGPGAAPGAIELRQLYVFKPWHGTGVAAELTRRVNHRQDADLRVLDDVEDAVAAVHDLAQVRVADLGHRATRVRERVEARDGVERPVHERLGVCRGFAGEVVADGREVRERLRGPDYACHRFICWRASVCGTPCPAAICWRPRSTFWRM